MKPRTIQTQTKSLIAALSSILLALATVTVITACSQKPSSEESEARTKVLVEQAVAEAKKEMLDEQAAEKARQEADAAAQAEEKRLKEAAAAEAKRARIAEQRAAAANAKASTTVSTSPPPPPPSAMKRIVCDNCGVVVSVTEVEVEGKGSGLGVIGGGVVGGLLGNQVGQGTGRDLATIAGAVGGAIAGNKIEKQAKKTKSYDIAVKMDSGEELVFRQDTLPVVASGDLVRIENEVVVKK